MQVTFFIAQDPTLDERLSLDPDRDWQLMRRQQRWMLQTCLRLERAGCPVRVSDRVPREGIVVFHVKHQSQLKAALSSDQKIVLVGVRGDGAHSHLADFEVLQNGRWADGKRRVFIPYWPQPGLIPRDPGRRCRVEQITYKGFDHNLHGYFFSPEWRAWIREQGLTWCHGSMEQPGSVDAGVLVNWHDYQKDDIVVAFRRDREPARRRRGHTRKPASKLCNAWHAGVPAILGPEYAYREQRRSDLDYIEIQEPEDAKQAILRLRSDPALYRAMVENGHRRAADFTQERILDRWREFLFEHVPREAARPGFRITRVLAHRTRARCRRMLRDITRWPKK